MNQTICGLFTGIPNYLMVPMAAKLVKRLGARVTAILAGVFGGVAYFTLFFIGYHPFGQTFGDHRILNFIWVVFGLTICGLPNKVIQVVNPILTAEALDYMEWKHGLRNEALVTTVQGYFQKLATSITSWMSGMVLTWINYIPSPTPWATLCLKRIPVFCPVFGLCSVSCPVWPVAFTVCLSCSTTFTVTCSSR